MRPSAKGWAAGAALLVLTLGAALGADRRTALALLVVPVVLLGLERYRHWSKRTRVGFQVLLGLATAGYCVEIVGKVRENLEQVPEWDFLGFWLHARTAVLGRSFYDPSVLRRWSIGFDFSNDFMREIVNVGFWYPPPSMFLFWPLGWFDPPEALALWYVFQVAVIAAVLILLRRIFFPGGGAVEWLACLALLCANHGTLLTFEFGQSNIVALLALLLFWRRRETVDGGCWSAVALFVKPFLAVLAVSMLVGARWRAVMGFVVAVVLLVLAALVAFGPRTTADYLAADQLGTKPSWIYYQSTNQSLLGWTLRVTDSDHCRRAECVRHPLFLTAAALLGAATLVLASLLARSSHGEWALGLLLLYALAAYPVSQFYYSVLLVPVVLLAWRHRDRIAGGPAAVAIGAGTIYALCAVEDGRQTLAAFCLLWLTFALVALRLIRRPAATPSPGATAA